MGNHHVGFILSEDKDFDVKVINALAQRSRYDSKVAFIKKAIVYYANHAKDEATGEIVSDNTSIEDILRSLNDTAEWVKAHYKATAEVVPDSKPAQKTGKEKAKNIRPVEKVVKVPEREESEDIAEEIRADVPIKEDIKEEPKKVPAPEKEVKEAVTEANAEAESDDNGIEVDDGFFSDFLDN